MRTRNSALCPVAERTRIKRSVEIPWVWACARDEETQLWSEDFSLGQNYEGGLVVVKIHSGKNSRLRSRSSDNIADVRSSVCHSFHQWPSKGRRGMVAGRMPAFLNECPEGTLDGSPGLNAGRKPTLCARVMSALKSALPTHFTRGRGRGGRRMVLLPRNLEYHPTFTKPSKFLAVRELKAPRDYLSCRRLPDFLLSKPFPP